MMDKKMEATIFCMYFVSKLSMGILGVTKDPVTLQVGAKTLIKGLCRGACI